MNNVVKPGTVTFDSSSTKPDTLETVIEQPKEKESTQKQDCDYQNMSTLAQNVVSNFNFTRKYNQGLGNYTQNSNRFGAEKIFLAYIVTLKPEYMKH